ncbi:MAG: UDP-N-acetylglucosamine 2-epimerase [Bdellovibrionales bacterium]|nr:UDP-N-acetylglucosamine 2-epimerase [Bdellovibrionales bacterium]
MVLNFILGTAAELIKVYPVIRLAREGGHSVRLIASGQSRENLLMQFRDFNLPESELLWLVQSHGDLEKSSSALKWFSRAMLVSTARARSLMPDGFVVVHGDTLSTLVGARLGRKIGLPVVHVEAGLRSASLFNPFPEEINRRLVSRRAAYHMAPDVTAEQNLKRAGVTGTIVNTGGNTLMDAVRLSGETARAKAPFALANIHRFENLNSPARWQTIIRSVLRASEKLPVVFVTHPQTRHKLSQNKEAQGLLENSRIEIRERMPFSQFIGLLKDADYLLTDGGSNQEECSYLGKPCLILRESTERVEGLDGCCVLSRFDEGVIEGFMSNPSGYERAPAFTSASPSLNILNFLEKNAHA